MATSLLQSTFAVAIFCLIDAIEAYKINITNFGNCDDVTDVKVNLTAVWYDINGDGLCDTVHGRYFVSTTDPGIKYELWQTIYQCPTDSSGQCNDNEKKYVEPLHCDRFHGDDTGPWYMISSAMKGSRCGERIGEYDLTSAQLLPQYLKKYLKEDPDLSRYRIHMLFHKKGDDGSNVHPRGCVNMEFRLIF